MPLSIEKNAPKCTTLEPSRSKGLKECAKNFAMAGLSEKLQAPTRKCTTLMSLVNYEIPCYI